MSDLIVSDKVDSEDTLSDVIITDYILTDTSFHGHNYSRSTVSGKFFIFRAVNTNFRLKEQLRHKLARQTIKSRLLIISSI